MTQFPAKICAVLLATGFTLANLPVQGADDVSTMAGSGAGSEIQDLEKSIVDKPAGWATPANPGWKKLLFKDESGGEPDKPALPRETPAVTPSDTGAAASSAVVTEPPAESAGDGEQRFAITQLELSGDGKLLDQLGLTGQIKDEVIGRALSERKLLDIATRVQNTCVSNGYYLARISMPPQDYTTGKLIYAVDAGRVGTMTFYEAESRDVADATLKVPFRETHFSEKQIRRQMHNLREGDFFDYNDLYRTVFSVNVHPDLLLHTDLKMRKELEGDTRSRYADMLFYVEDDLPLHCVLEVKNTGTKATDEWRASGTVQHLNVTRHDDVLTLNAISSMDFETLFSFAGSYYLPHYIGNGGAFTLYGGYSDVKAEEIVPLIDLIGTGWFVGLQGSYKLIDNERHLLNLAVGAVMRSVEDGLTMEICEGQDEEAVPTQESKIIPASVALSYSSMRPDRLGGRNFLTSQTSFNLGGSDDAELALQRPAAKSDYVIERIQAARLQPLWGRNNGAARSAQWLLMIKLDGQVATKPLIPVEQKAAGGMDTVRGYGEREALGDNGVSGTAELRTPLFLGLLSTRNGNDTLDKFQFVTFVDAAVLSMIEPVEGEETSRTLAGAGAGIRVELTRHSQFKFDWGFPLETTDISDSGGRAHISLQAQF